MQEPDQNAASPATLASRLFQDLSGTWLLNRKLQSANPSEPSGRCEGKATFAKTPPSPFINADGKLELADVELLYHEQGEFEMSPSASSVATSQPNLKFSFSRKYIWRLTKAEDAYTISIWFTKPGTNTLDYLFHKIDIPFHQNHVSDVGEAVVLRGSGGHLCVEDFYSSSYTFKLSQKQPGGASLSSWSTMHEVRGPKKDQIIETTFTQA